MFTKRVFSTALLGLMLVGTTADACFMRSVQPVQVWLDHINVDINNQIAVKTYNCTFKNANSQAVVGGTCYMELEPGAQIDNMSVLIDGKEMKAEILDVDQAKKVFTDIVKNGGSPALLEFFGNQLIQTQVPRIAPNSTVTVKLQYTTVLQKRGGLVRLQMLNTNPKSLMQTLQSASVTVNINSAEPIKNIYSPTHEIKLEEKPKWDISANWSAENYTPTHPFVLYYQTAEQSVGASVITHREMDEEGSYMLMLSPTIGNGKGKITDEQILPKDVVFCVDTSGSMLKGKKMEQARAALKYCVESLRDGDRFNIVDFSTVARNFSEEGLVQLDENSRAKALKYVEKLHARGGTAIQEALDKSLKQLNDSQRLKMIVFATDGLPTIGERNPEKILRHIAKENTENVRIFVFGEGFDVNTKLLDFLALDHRGEADYILPEEDITKKISQFFDRVGSPIMSDLKVTVDGLEVKDQFPRQTPDVFKGEQVILYGRYTGHGEKTVKVSGLIDGKRQTFEYKLNFPEYSEDDKNSFVPRLWAGKKVDYLLSEIRKTPEAPKELVEEVTYLAKRYGIITPYTSFLVTDDLAATGGDNDGSTPNPTLGLKLQQQLQRKGGFGGVPGPVANAPQRPGNGVPESAPVDREKLKEEVVTASKKLADYRKDANKSGGSSSFYERADDALKENGKTISSLEAIRYIGNRTFYKQGKLWRDSEYDGKKVKNLKTIKLGSDEYFELLTQDSRAAKYLALGDVVVKVKGQWYRVEK